MRYALQTKTIVKNLNCAVSQWPRELLYLSKEAVLTWRWMGSCCDLWEFLLEVQLPPRILCDLEPQAGEFFAVLLSEG